MVDNRQVVNDSKERVKEGVIDEVLEPRHEWRVKVHGVYWHARTKGNANFSPGDHVQVVGRNDLKLLIVPI